MASIVCTNVRTSRRSICASNCSTNGCKNSTRSWRTSCATCIGSTWAASYIAKPPGSRRCLSTPMVAQEVSFRHHPEIRDDSCCGLYRVRRLAPQGATGDFIAPDRLDGECVATERDVAGSGVPGALVGVFIATAVVPGVQVRIGLRLFVFVAGHNAEAVEEAVPELIVLTVDEVLATGIAGVGHVGDVAVVEGQAGDRRFAVPGAPLRAEAAFRLAVRREHQYRR